MTAHTVHSKINTKVRHSWPLSALQKLVRYIPFTRSSDKYKLRLVCMFEKLTARTQNELCFDREGKSVRDLKDCLKVGIHPIN